MSNNKGWIGVDLDATLAFYDTWKGDEHIGRPIKKMVERVRKWLAAGEDVRIVSTRGGNGTEAVKIVQDWTQAHFGRALPVTDKKDAHMKMLWDDRTQRVEKNTGEKLAAVSHVFLTGAPGTGKTTEGPRIAKTLGLPYVQMDQLPVEEDHHFAGTDTLRKHLARYRKPRLLEGAQALGLSAEEIAPHRVIILDQPTKVLIERLMSRGLQDSMGKMHRGPSSRAHITSETNDFRGYVKDLRKRAPHAEYYYRKPPTDDALLEKAAVIKEEAGEFVLYTHDGKRVLGRHPSRDKALAQERAIQVSKAASMVKEIPLKIVVPETKAVKGRVTAELASNPWQRAKGLSKRASLAEDTGMLFDTSGPFWMKDTLIPLDLLFLTKEGTVLEHVTMPVVNAPDYMLPRYACSQSGATMALEVPAGWCQRHEVTPGDRVVLEA